ncbi:MAG: tectonin domain-containing protein [Isosphaeraceae bacterium]
MKFYNLIEFVRSILTGKPREWIRSVRSSSPADHHVIAAYFAKGLERWSSNACPDTVMVGDPIRQYPLFGQYSNHNDIDVLTADFQSMKNAGVTVVAAHVFNDFTGNQSTLVRVDATAQAVGIRWTPIFWSYGSKPDDLESNTTAAFQYFWNSPALFRETDGQPAVFWHVNGEYPEPRKGLEKAVDALRSKLGPVNIYMDDDSTIGRPNQNFNGDDPVNPWFQSRDALNLKSRAQGIWLNQAVDWAMKRIGARWQSAVNYVDVSLRAGFRPVLCTCPSYNEENWGYSSDTDGPHPGNCGIGGDRRHQPQYNAERDPEEWSLNLAHALGYGPRNAWLYIQAYDEWGEGSTLAPNSYQGFVFLSRLKAALSSNGWITDTGPYVVPPFPTRLLLEQRGTIAIDIGVGANGDVWTVRKPDLDAAGNPINPGGGPIVKWNGPLSKRGMGWDFVASMIGCARIAVAPDGTVWMVNLKGEIHSYRMGDPTPTPRGTGAQDIGIGANGDVWMVDAKDNNPGGGVIRKNNDGRGDRWDYVVPSVGCVRVSVAPDGTVWMVNKLGDVHSYRAGEPGPKYHGSGARDIGVGANGDVWMVDVADEGNPGGGKIRKNNDGLGRGNRWDLIEFVGCVNISVAPDGTVWMVNRMGDVHLLRKRPTS